ncbi:MAG: hypothetical protein K6G80_07355 [Treponema sp.]|nr:hypothetical protein [Treponema sp.]
MKKLLTLAVAAALCALSFACLSCKVEEEDYKWEGTKLSVSNWPENVTSITLHPDNSTGWLNLYDAGFKMYDAYFTGNTVLTIYYDRLTDREYDDYYGYGIRTDSETPFKVFINGIEAENENPAAVKTLYGEERELNVHLEQFRTSFDITGMKTVELTFENAPEKIKNKDIRLADENQWAYIDKDGLYENFNSVNISRKNSNGNWVECEKLGRNGLYVFDAYGQTFSVDYTVKDGYYSTVSDARFTVSCVENAELTVTEKIEGTLYNCKVYVGTRVLDGTVIKLSGGTVNPYDTTYFTNKSLTFEANLSTETEVTSASLSIQGQPDTEKTLALTINGNEYTGTWLGTSVYGNEDGRIALYIDGSDIQYNSPDYELMYYPDGLMSTTGPCWQLRYISSSVHYNFIMKEAAE